MFYILHTLYNPTYTYFFQEHHLYPLHHQSPQKIVKKKKKRWKQTQNLASKKQTLSVAYLLTENGLL